MATQDGRGQAPARLSRRAVGPWCIATAPLGSGPRGNRCRSDLAESPPGCGASNASTSSRPAVVAGRPRRPDRLAALPGDVGAQSTRPRRQPPLTPARGPPGRRPGMARTVAVRRPRGPVAVGTAASRDHPSPPGHLLHRDRQASRPAASSDPGRPRALRVAYRQAGGPLVASSDTPVPHDSLHRLGPSHRPPTARIGRRVRRQPASRPRGLRRHVADAPRLPRSDAPDLVDLPLCSGARAVPAGAGVCASGPCAPGNDRRAPRVVAGTSSICGGRQCSLPRPLSAVPTPGTTRRS